MAVFSNNKIMKPSVCLNFRVHQRRQLKAFAPCQVDTGDCYFDEIADETLTNKMADECYMPANSTILSNILRTDGLFKVGYSISGTTLELLLKYRPDVIHSFKDLVKTGSVEILAETYYNSPSFLYSTSEFERQIEKHSELILKLFDFKPRVFRNTELIFNNDIARHVYQLGYHGMLCEGVQQILRGRTPNRIYAVPDAGEFSLLLRNSMLSDDIAFRFDDENWNEYPLTASKFARWIHSHPVTHPVVNLFLGYETFGIHKKKDCGIFDFLDELPQAVLANKNFQFSTLSEVIEQFYLQDVYDSPFTISWEDQQSKEDWPGNERAMTALKKISSLERFICNSGIEQAIKSWGILQDADYLLHLPSEQYEHYKNIVLDLEIRLIKEQLKKNKLDFIPFSPNAY
jgi:alpha-amylase